MNLSSIYIPYGSLGIEPTRNFTQFFKIGFLVDGGGFYYFHQGNKSDKENKIVRKQVLRIQKDLLHF